MPTVLFPTDLSPLSARAFSFALRFADALDARIVALHVMEDTVAASSEYVTGEELKSFYAKIREHRFKNFRDSLPGLRQQAETEGYEGLTIDHAFIEGEIETVIVAQARELEADYIVMGTKGAGAVKEIFFGSVAGEIMEKAPCPVLAIPKDHEFDGNIDRIAVTTDFSERDVRAIEFLIPLAAAFRSEIYCLHVDLAHTEALNRRMDHLRLRFAPYGALHFRNLDATDFESAILDFVESRRIDLIASVIEERNFFQELFHRSRAKQLSYHTSLPVLSIPAQMLEQPA
jgi:nucleotide-binding universal stress UspA family protein